MLGGLGICEGGIPPSLCQLPVRGISRHNAEHRKRQKPSFEKPTPQPFCALWCASHTSFYNLCLSTTLSPKFKLTPGLCVCVCVCVCVCLHEFAMSFSVFECCICELCDCGYVCVWQSLWLQALMRQRGFLFLWPLSKHIKNYLITAYTARATHTTHIHTHTLNTILNAHTPHSQKDSFDSKHTKLAAKLIKCHWSIEEEEAGLESISCQSLVDAEPSVTHSGAKSGL